MRRWFSLTLAALAGLWQLAQAQAPAVYRITVSGVVENGAASGSALGRAQYRWTAPTDSPLMSGMHARVPTRCG